MKICGIRTYKFSVPTGQEIRDSDTGELLCSTSKPWLFLKIDTDAGLSGWGEGTGEWLVPGVGVRPVTGIRLGPVYRGNGWYEGAAQTKLPGSLGLGDG